MRWMRHVLGFLIVLLITFGIAIPAATFLAPNFGHQLFAIRGSSMSPTIPMGALIAVSKRPIADVQVGDIVTWRGDNGVWVTHRVIELVEENGERGIRTQGDANTTPDAAAVPARALVGVVDASVPIGGFVMTLLSTPGGLVSWLSFGLALLALDSFLADIGPSPTTQAQGR